VTAFATVFRAKVIPLRDYAQEDTTLKNKMLLLNLARRCRHWHAIVVFVWLSVTAPYVAADARDTFNVTVGTNVIYDSNIFRTSSLVDPLRFGSPTRSDLIFISSATVNMRKLLGMQRFEANGIFADNRYDNHQFLTFFAKNYNAGWAWYLTPYFHGNVKTDHTEALNNFANLTGFLSSGTRNLRTIDNHRFDAILEVTRGWHLMGGVSEYVAKNTQLTVQDFNNRVISFEGGIRYVSPAGSTLTYTARHGLGVFMDRPAPIVANLFDTRFNDMEHELRLAWPVTTKTSIDARVGHFERKHAHFSQRDFSGFVGNFNVNWAVTAKTRVTAGWARDLSNFQTATTFLLPDFARFSSSYAVTDRFSVTPVWQISPKTSVRLRYEYTARDFHGPVVPVAANRSDTTHSGQIALDWQPLNMLVVNATLQREHRSSNLLGFDYNVSSGSISAKLNF
jgi:exopolysaccharide biosynthesis operon protein EpsL